jgi:tetratricopeptide (TPR) repeat protein
MAREIPNRASSLIVALAAIGFFTCMAASAQSPPILQSEADTSLTVVQSLLDRGQTSDAEKAARANLEKHPDSAEAHFLLGYTLFKEIQTDAEQHAVGGRDEYQQPSHAQSGSSFRDAAAKASLAEFTSGAKYRKPSAFDLKIVALDYIVLQDFTDADKWLTRSVQLNPQDEQAWYYLGRAKYNENRFEEAIRAFDVCLQRDPRSVKAEDNLGLAYAGLGRSEEAISAFKNAIAWQENAEPKDPGPYIDMGGLLLDQNRAEESVPYLHEASEIAPGNSKAHELLGKAYSRLNQAALALRELEKAAGLAPQVASIHCMLGPVYRKQGLAEKAKAEFDRCATLNASQSAPAQIQP